MSTPKMIDDCRRFFENWYWPNSNGDIPEGARNDDGTYFDFNSDLAWDSWQAAWKKQQETIDAMRPAWDAECPT